jgi:hypothetical protein
MKKKIIIISSVMLVLILGLVYANYSNLIAGDRDGKSCTSTSGCTSKSNDVKADNEINAGNEFATYEFSTDQACCDDMKNTLKTNLLTVAGVKEVNFGMSCSYSKVSNVQVKYDSKETNEESITSYLKEMNYDCTGKSGCNTESGSKKECVPNKNKKTNSGKEI